MTKLGGRDDTDLPLERYVTAMAHDDTDRLAGQLLPTTRVPVHAVADVMTTAVVTVHTDAPFKEIARALECNHISVVPVIDDYRAVVGVVTASDLLARIGEGPSSASRGAVAENLMTSPAITTTPTTPIGTAAKQAARARVRALPVVDSDGRLTGIVARSDLVKYFLRDDVDVRSDVERDVIRPNIAQAEHVDVEVAAGVVTLRGRVSTGNQARRLTHAAHWVPGVIDVHDALEFDAARMVPGRA